MTGHQKMVIGWTVFLVGGLIVWVGIFSAMEGYALHHDDALTLSRFLWDVSQAWPPIVFLAGLVIGLTIGILTSHLFWRWDPTNPVDHRG